MFRLNMKLWVLACLVTLVFNQFMKETVCNTTDDNYIYASNVMTCVNCKALNEYAVADSSGSSCICGSGSYSPLNSLGLNCARCPTNYGPTEDKTDCMYCGSTTVYDSSLGVCTCSSSTGVLLERNQDGSLRTEKVCVECADATRMFKGLDSDGMSPTDCTPCPVGQKYTVVGSVLKCSCDDTEGLVDVGGHCLLSSNRSSLSNTYLSASSLYTSTAGNINFYTQTIISGYVSRHLVSSIMRCRFGFEAAGCQQLIGLCVMSDLVSSSEACSALSWVRDELLSDGTLPVSASLLLGGTDLSQVVSGSDAESNLGLPLITSDDVPSEVYSSLINGEFTFRESGNRTVDLVVGAYDTYGKFKGFYEVGNTLQLCRNPTGQVGNAAVGEWQAFGLAVDETCQVDVRKLVRCLNLQYELFVRNADQTLTRVPVRVLNSQAGAFSGEKISELQQWNALDDSSDSTVLQNRFLLCDSISALTEISYLTNMQTLGSSALTSGIIPPSVRYAKNIYITMFSSSSATEKIHMPVVSIVLGRVDTEVGTDGDLQQQFVSVSFKSEFASPPSRFLGMVLGVVISFSIVGFILAALKVWLLGRATRVKGAEPVVVDSRVKIPFPKMILRQLFVCVRCVITGYSFGICVLCVLWLIFFKFQSDPFLLLPSFLTTKTIYTFIDVSLILVAIFATLNLILGIIIQGEYFVFFLNRDNSLRSQSGPNNIEKNSKDTHHDLYGADAGAALEKNRLSSIAHHQILGTQTLRNAIGRSTSRKGTGQFKQRNSRRSSRDYRPEGFDHEGLLDRTDENEFIDDDDEYDFDDEEYYEDGTQSDDSIENMTQLMGNRTTFNDRIQNISPNFSAEELATASSSGSAMSNVAAWSTLFTAQVFHSCVGFLRVRSAFLWMFMMVFLELLNWRDVARWGPSFVTSNIKQQYQSVSESTSTSDGLYDPPKFNSILQVGISSLTFLLLLAIAVTTRILWRICSSRGAALQELVRSMSGKLSLPSHALANDIIALADFCAASNTSVIVMDSMSHGWYIHGQSKIPVSDLSMSELLRLLAAARHSPPQGLIPGDALQTFELFLTPGWQQKLVDSLTDVIATGEEVTLLAKSNGIGAPVYMPKTRKMSVSGDMSGIDQAAIAAELRERSRMLENASAARMKMAKMTEMRAAVGSVEQVMLELLQGAECKGDAKRGWTWGGVIPVGIVEDDSRTGTLSNCTVLKDRSGASIGNAMLRGVEGDLLLATFFVFLVVFRFTDTTSAAAIISVLMTKLMVMLREWCGKLSLQRSALIDTRFLIAPSRASNGWM